MEDFYMTKEEFGKIVHERRDFLHDISNKLTIAEGMTSIVVGNIASGEGNPQEMLAKLDKSIKAIQSVVLSVREERQKLIDLSQD